MRRSGETHRMPWLRTPEGMRRFRDEASLLRDLQRQWSIELGGALFAAIRDGGGDLAQDVATAYGDTLARLHHIHQVLEAHADHPAIRDERAKEHKLLESAGLRSSYQSVA